jgi:hypothetical protein
MEMMMQKTIATVLFAGILTAPSFAQTAPPPGTEGARGQNQQQRIGQGVQSGQLTRRETSNLEHREASIHNEKQNMRAADNGHLTGKDRRILNQRQNRTSAAIARDKHNNRVR